MDTSQLRQTLEQLHAELQQAESLDENTRANLHSLMQEIQAALARPDDGTARQYSPLNARLQKALLQFEVSHPALTITIGQVANELAQMGL